VERCHRARKLALLEKYQVYEWVNEVAGHRHQMGGAGKKKKAPSKF